MVAGCLWRSVPAEQDVCRWQKGSIHTVPSPPYQLMLNGRPKVMPVKAMLPKAMDMAGGLAKEDASSIAAAKQPPAIDESILKGYGGLVAGRSREQRMA